MKRDKYTITKSIDDTTKIWRGNKEPEDKTTNENLFNNPSKYIRNFMNTSLLEEFPEFLIEDNNIKVYTPVATNTGLMCFYKNPITNTDGKSIAGELIIYDILVSDNIEISSISPDIAPMLDYDYITNPLNVRHLNFSGGTFLPDREYKNGDDRYILIDCDNLDGCAQDNNGYFISKDNPDTVKFNYRPILVVKIFNNSGEIYTGDIDKSFTPVEKTEVSENGTEKKVKTGIYYMDCSTIITAEYISISAPSESGYMEVL